MSGVTLENLAITETFYGWFTKTNEIINSLNDTVGSGISGAGLSGDNLIITLVDGTTFDAGTVLGPQGVGVSSGSVVDNHLIIALSNGVTIDVGNVRGPQGSTGAQGGDGPTGEKGTTGTQGLGLPPGGLVGFSLVKKDNQDYNTEWKDTSLQIKGTPGNIGGWESKKVENILGEGPLTSSRNRFPRWSPNLYISEVHKGAGISLDGSTGFYRSAGYMGGNSSGYDDGVSAGYKVLNFFETTTRFEGNTYYYGNSADADTYRECGGTLLDGPAGFYWNRMKYFPTLKLTPIYISNYSIVDQYVIYVSGYRDGATGSSEANKKKRRGTFGFFGILPINSFPSGTPYSTHRSYDGFVDGSTCAYYFRPSSAENAGTTMAIARSNDDFEVTGVIDGSYTGDHVREVKAGRTGPIGLFPDIAGPRGISGGFTLEPGWYFIASEFIPSSWFSVNTSVDSQGTSADFDPIAMAQHSDGVLLTHTNASTHNGDIGLFGLNGFELAPEGELVNPSADGIIPTPFTPSCYTGISVVQRKPDNIRSLLHPTGLPPYLWYDYGYSGETGYGRFVTGGDGATQEWATLGPHIGLHSYDVSSTEASITEEGGLAVRAQDHLQASAPRIGLSIISTSNTLQTLETFNPGVREVEPPGCNYDCYNFAPSVWDHEGGGTFGEAGYTGGLTGQQLATGSPPAGTDQCPVWCCPGTTFARFAFNGTIPTGAPENEYLASREAGEPGSFIPFLVNDGGNCAVPSCGSTTGYVCGDCADGGLYPNVGDPIGDIDGDGVINAFTPGEACQVPSGLSTQEPPDNSGAEGGMTAEASSGRTISIYVNSGEDHHVKWFGAGAGLTYANHLIWNTSTVGCTTATSYNRYEGP